MSENHIVTPQATRYTARERFLLAEEEKKRAKRIKRQEKKKALDQELKELKWKREREDGQQTLTQMTNFFKKPAVPNDQEKEQEATEDSFTQTSTDSAFVPVLGRPTILTPAFQSVFGKDCIPSMMTFNDWCTREEERHDAELQAKLAVKASHLGKRREVRMSQFDAICDECGGTGAGCHSLLYGRYCIDVVRRYHYSTPIQIQPIGRTYQR